MRKLLSINFIIVPALFFFAGGCVPSQHSAEVLNIKWDRPQQLNSPELSAFSTLNGVNTIAVDGDTVHAAWVASISPTQSDIYYAQSSDSGATWQPAIQLTNHPGQGRAAAVNASGQNVVVAWVDQRDNDNGEVYYAYSDDGGATWSREIRLTNDEARTALPVLSVVDSVFYLTFENYVPKCSGFLARSFDGGKSWVELKQVTEKGLEVGGPNIVGAQTGPLHLVYGSTLNSEATQGYNWENYYRSSADQGESWSTPVRLTDDETGDSRFPQIALDGKVLHVTWWDDRDDTAYEHLGYPDQVPGSDHNYEIYYQRSLNDGQTWEKSVRLTQDGAVSRQPSIAAYGNRVFIAWTDQRNGTDEIYLKYSLDAGATWSQESLVSKGFDASERVTVKVDAENVYLAWTTQEADMKYVLYFLKGDWK
ncbi:glycoside hydrolase [Patescibacteria group bacterium]|nr:glycoside hydrolase [Patescibacteria group bacterium]MBU1906636.1 glycoside hydrolase [Patescibacteria group bacterium]